MFKLVLLCVPALWLLIAFSPARPLQSGSSPFLQKYLAQTPELPAPPQRVYLRVGGQSSEGIGSVVQHFKQSVIMSLALNATFTLTRQFSPGRGSSRPAWHGASDGRRPARACVLEDRVSRAQKAALARAWCAREAWALAEIAAIGESMRECAIILDLMPDDAIQDLNGCIIDWVRERLAGPAPSSPPSSEPASAGRPVTVGIQISRSDAAGTMPPATLNRVLGDIYTRWGARVRVAIAMENHDAGVLAQLAFPAYAAPYTLLDTPADDGDPLADLRAISGSDVLLIGASSYALLAHLIAPPGLTVLDYDYMDKFTNTSAHGRHVVEMKDYSAESLDILDGAGYSSESLDFLDGV